MRTYLLIVFFLLYSPWVSATGSRLISSGGITSFEGSSGGGITPWALIAGYGAKEEVQGSGSLQLLDTGEYQLKTVGFAIGLYDRLELSYQRQTLSVSSAVVGNVFNVLTSGTVDSAPGTDIEQDVVGLKLKLWGDAIFSEETWAPQISLGIQYKQNLDFETSLPLADGSVALPDQGIPLLLGAKDDSGTDVYLSASKYLLGVAGGNNLLANMTARWTKANTFGLLGFSSNDDDDYSLEWEGSIVVALSPFTAVGAEWRTQTDRLDGLAKEETVNDVFIAYFPNKTLSLTAAYVDLGNLPFDDNASGFYLSVTVNL
ncbi:hypothetical protein A9Q99_04825 [Gammaproteobacteria bacterium 45_16_T64]|nr:hypothetical protein A9Q99_04825 [Gammaproteobacteria bacterium 45_16_T64]